MITPLSGLHMLLSPVKEGAYPYIFQAQTQTSFLLHFCIIIVSAFKCFSGGSESLQSFFQFPAMDIYFGNGKFLCHNATVFFFSASWPLINSKHHHRCNALLSIPVTTEPPILPFCSHTSNVDIMCTSQTFNYQTAPKHP
jgi:hypothetical protein